MLKFLTNKFLNLYLCVEFRLTRTSELVSWSARGGKNALSSDFSRNSDSWFSNTTASTSYIKLWTYAFIFHFTKRLWCWRIPGYFFPSNTSNFSITISIDNFFLRKNCFFFVKSMVSWWIYHFCVILKAIITMWLRFLLSIIKTTFFNSLHQYSNQSVIKGLSELLKILLS